MSDPYSVGLATVANGATAVTGTDTFWVGKVRKNDMFFVPAQGLQARVTADPADNDALAITAWAGTSVVDAAYEIIPASDTTTSSARLRDLLAGLSLIEPNFDAQVDDLAARAAYNDEAGPSAGERGFAVLVSDVGDGRSAIYSKNSGAPADWSDPAYFSGPVGPLPEVTVGTVTTGNPGTSVIVTPTPTMDGVELDFTIPAGRGPVIEGDYNPATAYVLDDVVLYNGSSWIALGPTTGNMPPTLPTTSSSYWQLLARQGIDGAGTVNSIVAGDGIAVDNTNPTAPVVSAKLTAAGQCYLTVSAGDLILLPRDGNQLSIGGDFVEVPSAGVSLAATGKTAGTLYYIYAYLATGVLTLEAETTGHSTDSATGVEVKTGDASRTFVGWAVPSAGPTWVVTASGQFVRSYFNDAGLLGTNALSSDITYAVNDWAELSSGARVQFISRGERVDFGVVGVNYCVTNGKLYGTCVGLDGSTPLDGPYVDCSPNVSAGLNWTSIGATWPVYVAEGLHYATIVGRSYDAASVVWRGSASASAARCVLNAVSGKASGGEPVDLMRVVGTIRSTAGTWELITTGNHRPIGVASVSQDSSAITITFDFTGSNVVGGMVGLDETFATSSVIDKVGASVGLGAATIKIGKLDGSGNTSVINPSSVSDASGNIWFSFELDR